MMLQMLLFGIFWIACGTLAANFLWEPFGLIGYFFGFITGVIISYLLTWVVLVKRAEFFFPLPLCRQGKCQLYDYRWPIGTLYGWNWGIYHYKCKCGDEYRRIGKRFMVVLSDGEAHPYKKIHNFREWIDDESCNVVETENL